MGRADVSDVVYLIKIDPQEYIDVPIISLIVKVGPLCILASIQLLGGTPMLARSKLGCTFPPCNCSKVAILRPLPRPLDRKMISILDSDKIHMLHYFLLIFFFVCVCVCQLCAGDLLQGWRRMRWKLCLGELWSRVWLHQAAHCQGPEPFIYGKWLGNPTTLSMCS